MSLMKLIPSTLAILAASTVVASARDQLQIAGSSTVLPYATIVAEAFGENAGFKTPVVEGGGSGAGRKKLCEGVGEDTIDIANSSSRIKQSDIDTCAANGVNEIMEVRIGYDGVVFASDLNGPDFVLTPADLFGALAAETVKDGAVVANAPKTWADVNPALPAQDILVFIPGSKHGTREVFDTKVMEEGCKASGAYDAFVAASTAHRRQQKRCRRLWSVLLRKQHRQAEGRDHERHRADGRDHRQGRIPGVASALLLRQKSPYRRDPRPERIHPVLRLGRNGWSGWRSG
jgi:phosphate transport system substrate-binding protein